MGLIFPIFLILIFDSFSSLFGAIGKDVVTIIVPGMMWTLTVASMAFTSIQTYQEYIWDSYQLSAVWEPAFIGSIVMITIEWAAGTFLAILNIELGK
jgi:hypothetical protein